MSSVPVNSSVRRGGFLCNFNYQELFGVRSMHHLMFCLNNGLGGIKCALATQ